MSQDTQKTILRKNKVNDFTLIHNKILRDTRLSWKARGILCYLLSLPDDWHFNKEYLKKQSERDKDTSFDTGWDELKHYGYLTFHHGRTECGKHNTNIWTLHEDPVKIDENSNNVSATQKIRVPENQATRESGTTNTNWNSDLKNKEEVVVCARESAAPREKISKNELYQHSLAYKKDWVANEIEDAYEIYSSTDISISCPFGIFSVIFLV
mgnify:CR=1 FL=1